MSHDKPIAAGTSSFDLVDLAALLPALGLRAGETMLDLACGRGAYTIALAPLLGAAGRIYAVDLWREGIEALRAQVAERRLSNVTPLIADVGVHLPLAPRSVDLCFMATVLHDLVEDGTDTGALAEVGRVLREPGRLAIVEFKKIDGPPGPPRRIRLAAEEVTERVRPYGFHLVRTVETGPFTYAATFTRA